MTHEQARKMAAQIVADADPEAILLIVKAMPTNPGTQVEVFCEMTPAVKLMLELALQSVQEIQDTFPAEAGVNGKP